MADTPAPDGSVLPESPLGMRSRPADVVTQTPIIKGPAAADATTRPAARPGIPPADSPALAVARADRLAESAEPDEARWLTTDQIMPTCMIYAMFGGLAILLGTMICWMLATFFR